MSLPIPSSPLINKEQIQYVGPYILKAKLGKGQTGIIISTTLNTRTS